MKVVIKSRSQRINGKMRHKKRTRTRNKQQWHHNEQMKQKKDIVSDKKRIIEN